MPAVTTRGLKEPEMEVIVSLIDRVIANPDDEKTCMDVRREVEGLMEGFPLYPELG